MDLTEGDKTISPPSTGSTSETDGEHEAILYIHAEEDSSGPDNGHRVSISYTDSSTAPEVKKTAVGKKFGLRAKGKFQDIVFTRNFSTFDPQNEAAANSPFYGFYTLFWLAVSLFMLKTAANNWRTYGNPLGTNEIMRNMFNGDGMSASHPCPRHIWPTHYRAASKQELIYIRE